MRFKMLWLGAFLSVVMVDRSAALSQLKVICDRDGESIFVDGKFKTECDKNEVVRLIIQAGTHRLSVKKVDENGRYEYVKRFKIGDGVQKVFESVAKPVYSEYHYYKKADKEKSLQACDDYLKRYPKGRYTRVVEEIKDYIKAKKDFSLYKKYRQKYPTSRYLDDLKEYYFEHPLIATLQGHGKAVYSLAISKDGSKLFSGGADNMIIEWDLQSGKAVRKTKGPTWITCLTLSPDEKRLAFGGDVGVLDLKKGKISILDKSASGEIEFIDNRKLAVATLGNRVTVWDIEKVKPIFSQVEDKRYSVSLDHLAVSPDRKYLFYDMYDNKNEHTIIKQLDLRNRQTVRIFHAPELKYDVRSLAVTPDGRYLISGAKNDAWYDEDGYVRKTLIVWDIKTAKPYRMFAQKGNINAVAVGPKGELLAYGSSRGKIFIRDRKNGLLLKVIETYSPIHDLAFTRDGKKLVGALENGQIKVWYSGFFHKTNMLNVYMKRCKKGDLKACNDYLLGGGANVKMAKNAFLKHFKTALKSTGGDIRYSFPKVCVQDRRGKYRYAPNKKAYSLYTVEAIVADKGKAYVLIDVDYHNTGFTFNNPIYLVQNGRKRVMVKKFPDVYKIDVGSKRMKLVFVFDGFEPKMGDYLIQESENPKEGYMVIRGGHIAKIF